MDKAYLVTTIDIFCDNEGAVSLTKEPNDHGRLRHIDRKYHYFKHWVDEDKIIMNRVSSLENPADPLTKVISKIKYFEHARSIGLRDDVRF